MDIKDIKQLADSNNLSFTPEELKTFQGEFEKILDLMKQLDDVKVVGSSGQSVTRSLSELRADEVRPSFTNEQVLANAPRKRDGCFVVPQVVE